MLKTLPWRMMAWGGAVGVLAGLLAVEFELVQGQICEYNQATKHEDCTTYSLFPFLLIQIGKTLNDYGVAITALATVFIGIFTLTLKLSTDKLWEAAKDQIAAAENTAKIQSADMNASIAVAKEAADAAKESAEAASASVRAFIDSERGRMFISEITLIKKDANDPQPTIAYSFVNGGRGTVIVLQVYIERELIGLEVPRDITYNPTKAHGANNAVSPGAFIGTDTKPVFLPPCAPFSAPLTADDYANIAAKKAWILVKGFIRYRTEFDDIYRRNFAAVYGFMDYFTNVLVPGYNEEYREPKPK